MPMHAALAQNCKFGYPAKEESTDLDVHENDNWSINAGLMCGLEYSKTGSGHRRVHYMIELYDGEMPFGQFYNVDIRSYGVSVCLLF